MKKKTIRLEKKLSLVKETITGLTESQQLVLNGGATVTDTCISSVVPTRMTCAPATMPCNGFICVTP